MDHQHQDEEFSNLALLLLPHLVPEPEPASIPADQVAVLPVQRPISRRRGKKRSSRACTSCRQRKVRCNIVAHGVPCSNCKHDEVDCILPLSRRQKSAKEREENSRNAVTGSAAEESKPSNEKCPNSNTTSSRIDSQRYISAPHGMRISEHVLSEVIPTASISTPSATKLPTPKSTRRESWNQILPPLASAPRSKCPETLLPQLPKVFAEFPAHLDPADLSYVQLRGALIIPSEGMQIQLLRAYVDFVHGQVPLLDLDEFMTLIKYGNDLDANCKSKSPEMDEGCESSRQISLLLFQAVMFAACEYVSMRVLREEGFATREMAQQVFFNRVRLLYDFDTCTDRLPIIQSLLLMTNYTTPISSEDGKTAHHWLGLAISLSYSLGLHRSIYSPHTSPQRQKLDRRVWWTCFVRDRTLALSTAGNWARPLRIKREDCDVEMLSLDDFDLFDGLEEGESIEDRRTRASAVAFVEKAVLCWCSTDTLVTHHAVPSSSITQSPSRLGVKMTLESRTDYSVGEGYYCEDSSDIEMHESILSPSEHCITPRYDIAEAEEVRLRYTEKDLEQGYGVDDEYDDYLEYFGFESQVDEKDKEGEKGPWALQLDCENDRMIEV